MPDLDYPAGRKPSFFLLIRSVLTADFSENRALNRPTIDQVKAFPLIKDVGAWARRGRRPEPAHRAEGAARALGPLGSKSSEDSVPRSINEDTFSAIQVRFTSFKRVDSFYLLTVRIGKELEFNMSGIST